MKLLIAFAVLVAATISATGRPWVAVMPILAGASTGNDVSYPQCGSTLPSGQAFGIVGVNDGVANTTNPCLAEEMSWAAGSSGATSQPKVALYVNTANPGNLGVADWPTGNVDPVTGALDADPDGTCDGADDQACAWQYGWNMADLDAHTRLPANADPSAYRWWLDVENGNSWETNTSNNAADLEGMVAAFESVGATVGLYSTAYQWGQIAGAVSPSSAMYTLPDWVPGATSSAGAQSNCGTAPLTGGGGVLVTQWTQRSAVDSDFACPEAVVSVSIQQGWNLIDVAEAGTGLHSAIEIASSMTAPGSLPAGSVHAVATYAYGRFVEYAPDYSPSFPVAAGQGIFVLSGTDGQWAQSGASYTGGVPVELAPGWNLVAAPYPAGGLSGADLDAQLGGSSGCGLQEAATYAASGYTVQSYAEQDSFQVPFTAGVWLLCSSPYTWTPG